VETALAYRGWHLLVLENRNLRVALLPEKGSDIIEFRYKPLDLNIMWESPLGLRAKEWFVPTNSQGKEGNFMDYYQGGWQEIFPNTGPATDYKGTTIGQHGEVALSPWTLQILEETERRVSVKLEVKTYRTPFSLKKVLSIEGDEPSLYMEETVTNLAGERVEFSWGHHPAIGAPFLSEKCLVNLPGTPQVEVFSGDGRSLTNLLPGKGTWPVVKGKNGEIDLRKVPSFQDKVSTFILITSLLEGKYEITNPEKRLSFRMEWETKVFSHLWYWLVAGGSFHYPWWGMTYNLALEPMSGPPILSEALQKGKALSLEAGQSLTTKLSATFIPV